MKIDGIPYIPTVGKLLPTMDFSRIEEIEFPEGWEDLLNEQASNAIMILQEYGDDAFELFIQETFNLTPYLDTYIHPKHEKDRRGY